MPSTIDVAFTLAVASLVGCAPPPAHPFSGQLPPFEAGARFIVAGDLQRTSWLEFWRESNDSERARVVAALASERPAFLALTGDLVFDGSSAAKWADFDALMTPVRDAGTPVFAAFGNHELWGGRAGDALFFARFPHLARKRWFVIAFGPLRIVTLDSNPGALTDAEQREQLGFYEGTLAAWDDDPAVQGVAVLLHHPPYTNSTVTGDEPHVQRHFVPPFARAKKTLLMQSGHVHSYERYQRWGKTLVVSGGGGGPRAALDTGPGRRHRDDLFDGPSLRDFNYVVYTMSAAGLAAEVRGLAKGKATWRTLDRFTLAWSRP